MSIITGMLLKSEGFRDYKGLSDKINTCINKLTSVLNLNERDDSYSITVRDLKRLSKAASACLEQELINKSN
jgi:hypothetical protein